MAQIPLGTRFIGISEEVDLKERGSTFMNRTQEPYNMQDIIDSIPLGAPDQVTLAADDTTISTTTVLTASSVNIIDTADAQNNAVKLADPVFGSVTHVVNTSGVDILVFPNDATGSIYGLAAGASVTVPSDGLMYTFTCIQNPNVGVWTITTPATGNNSTRVSVEYDQTLTSNAAGGNMIVAGAVGAQAKVISNSPSIQALSLQNPASSLILSTPIFSNYNHIKIHSFEVLTNIETGNLTANQPTTAEAFGYVDASGNQGFYNIVAELGCVNKSFTSPNTFLVNMPMAEARFDEIFNFNYRANNYQPLADGSSAYVAGPNDPAPAGTIAIKHYSEPTYGWFRLFDDNGFDAIYFLLRFYLGSQFLSQATSIPDQSEVKWKVKVTFDLKK